jgi:sorting nexin-3/12
MTDTSSEATRRLNVKRQTLDDAYAAPANFLEIDVINPVTHGVGKKRYTDYEVRMRVGERKCLADDLNF